MSPTQNFIRISNMIFISFIEKVLLSEKFKDP